MRRVNLDDLTDRTPAEIIAALQAAGYEPLPFESRGTLFHYAHPDAPDEMLRLTFMGAAAERLAAIARAQPGNPYLPAIHECRALGGNPALTLVTMERLYHADEIPPDVARVMRGIARAVALLPVGETNHADAHRHMLKNAHMRDAARAFAAAAAQSHDGGGDSALHYETGMDHRLPIDEQFTGNVLFRRDGKGWCPVFADPLRIVAVRGRDHRDGLRRACADMHLHLNG